MYLYTDMLYGMHTDIAVCIRIYTICVCIYVYMYVCRCAYMYVYIYIYLYMYRCDYVYVISYTICTYGIIQCIVRIIYHILYITSYILYKYTSRYSDECPYGHIGIYVCMTYIPSTRFYLFSWAFYPVIVPALIVLRSACIETCLPLRRGTHRNQNTQKRAQIETSALCVYMAAFILLV